MNRVGRLLICIAGGVALNVTAHADITPSVNPTYHNTPLRQNMALRNTNFMNRMLMMQKLHSRKDLPRLSHQVRRQTDLPLPNLPPSSRTAADTAPTPAVDSALAGNPYESIVTRNVFGLNPIPIGPPQQEGPPGPPPPKITLTGIMTIFGPPEALFKVAGVVRGNSRPQDESYIFTEGEEQDEVEVTRIDTNKDIVSFMNHGVAQDIPLADGVASSGSAPSAPSWPGQNSGRHRPFSRFGNPGGNPGGIRPQSYNSSPYSGGNNGSQNGYNNVFNNNDQQSNLHNPNDYIAPGVAGLSDEDQQALIAAAHAAAASGGGSGGPTTATPEMFPPTQFDPDAGVPPGPGNAASNPGGPTAGNQR